MKSRDEMFLPEQLDEQIELHASAQTSPPTTNARLVQDLQHMAQDDVQRLARIRAKLATQFVQSHTEKQPIPISNFQPAVPSALLSNPVVLKPARVKGRRRLLLVAGLVATIVIASVLTLISQRLVPSGQTSPHASPTAVVNEVVEPGYYANVFDSIVKLDAKTGAIKWRFPFISSEDTPIQKLVVSDHRVFVSVDEVVIALDANNGKQVWRYLLPAEQGRVKKLIPFNNKLYVMSEHAVMVLHPISGNVERVYQPSAPVNQGLSGMVVTNESLVVDNGGSVCVLQLNSGKTRWCKEILATGRSGITSNLQITSGRLFFTVAHYPEKIDNSDGGFWALGLDMQTGEQVWQLEQSKSPYLLSANNGIVYYSNVAASRNSILYAHDVVANRLLWQKDVGDSIDNIDVASNKLLVSVTHLEQPAGELEIFHKGVLVFDARTGDKSWSVPASQAEMHASDFGYTVLDIQNDVIYIDEGIARPKPGLISHWSAYTLDGTRIWQVQSPNHIKK